MGNENDFNYISNYKTRIFSAWSDHAHLICEIDIGNNKTLIIILITVFERYNVQME